MTNKTILFLCSIDKKILIKWVTIVKYVVYSLKARVNTSILTQTLIKDSINANIQNKLLKILTQTI